MNRVPFLSVVLWVTSLTLTAQTDTPLARSIERAAARSAATLTPAVEVGGGDSRPDPEIRSDWSRVMRLEDDDIVVSLRDSSLGGRHGTPSGKRTLVRGTVSPTGLTVLNLTDSSIPREARKALMEAASVHPEYFAPGAERGNVRLNKHVRLDGGAVLVDDRKAAELEHVIERIDRRNVTEISRVHRATKKDMGWGAIAGEGIALAEVFARCGTHWNNETSSCGNLTGVVLFAYPVLGVMIGAAIGAATDTTTLVYRAP